MTSRFLKVLLTAIIFFFQSPVQSAEINSNPVEKIAIEGTKSLVRMVLAATRGFVDLQYSDVSFEKRFDRLSINKLKILPQAELFEEGCEIEIKSIKILSSNFPDFKQKFHINGFSASALCLPYEQRVLMALAGIKSLDIPMIYFDLKYNPASGGLAFSLSTEIQNLVEITVSFDTDYVAYNFIEDIIKLRLREAEITLQNKGIWERFKNQLPPSFVTAGTSGANISLSINQMLSGIGITSSNAKENLLRSIENTWDEFLRNEDTIALRTNFDQESPRNLRIYDYSQDFSVALYDLQPIFANKNIGRDRIKPMDDIAWLFDGNEASDQQKLDTAKALISGKGLPQNIALGMKILKDPSTFNDPESFSLLASHLILTEPEKAYIFALKGAALGNADAAHLAMKIEDELPLLSILEIQDELGRVHVTDLDPNEINNYAKLANDYYTGTFKLKSYKSAYLYANLSAAAGNITATSIREDILNMANNENPSVRLQWQKSITEVADKTLNFWISEKLSEKLLD